MRSLKQLAGAATACVSPQCRFEDCVFVLGHMRSGSTALSNVLSGRAEISGYGEAHIAYRDRAALGILTLNQLRRRSWRPGAPHLFDKLLHSRYDAQADPAFFTARAIFMVREPGPAILSIHRLFAVIGSGEYPDHHAAALYYDERVRRLAELWRRFPPDRRLGVRYERLVAQPDAGLVRVGRFLDLATPLANSYSAPRASLRRGAGDPLRSGGLDRIAVRQGSGEEDPLELPRIDAALWRDVIAAHRALVAAFEPELQPVA